MGITTVKRWTNETNELKWNSYFNLHIGATQSLCIYQFCDILSVSCSCIGYHSHLSSRTDIPSFTMDFYRVCNNQSIIDLIVCLRMDAPLWVFAYIIFVMSLIHDLSFMLKYRGYHRNLSSRTDIPPFVIDLYRVCNNRSDRVCENQCATLKFFM